MTNDYRAMCAELLSALKSWSPYGGGPLERDEAETEASLINRARALLDQQEPQHPQPVAVSERLPGPDDCTGDGEVWAWRRFDSENMDNGDFWCLAFCEWLEDEDCNFTHWLPANALPTPEALDD